MLGKNQSVTLHVLHKTVLYSTVICSTVLYCTVYYCNVQYSTVILDCPDHILYENRRVVGWGLLGLFQLVGEGKLGCLLLQFCEFVLVLWYLLQGGFDELALHVTDGDG